MRELKFGPPQTEKLPKQQSQVLEVFMRYAGLRLEPIHHVSMKQEGFEHDGWQEPYRSNVERKVRE
jgi:hypothetical protein